MVRLVRFERVLAGCALAAAVFAAAPARAEWIDDQAKVCAATDNDPDMVIGACTAAMQSGRWSGTNLAWAYNNRGIAYSNKGQYDRAIQDYDQALRLNPSDADAYHNRGNAYANKGQYDRAIQDYDQAIRLNPNDALAYRNREIGRAHV